MDWKKYLLSIGYTEAEITKMVTEFGADKVAKAFEQPVRDLEAAKAAEAAAKQERDEYDRFYQEDVLPKMSTVYQEAINSRTREAALIERLKAAKEYGFLSDPKTVEGAIPGAPAGAPITAPVNPIPGSPSVPGGPGAPTLDPRYVPADRFATVADQIPEMLGRLTDMSNEHFVLFGKPLQDAGAMIAEAKKQKKNVIEIWETKYKVPERRAEIDRVAKETHDRTVGEEAVRKYLSDHGQPFTRPGQVSVASHFTPQSTEEARHPWKGAADRKRDRHNKLLTEFQNPSKGTGTGARVQ